MNKNKRWYDKDSTVSLAVSILRDTTVANQNKAAQFLKEKGAQYQVVVKEFDIKSLFSLKKRWYDENEELRDALEYLKYAKPHDQKQIALSLIEFLYQQDSSINV